MKHILSILLLCAVLVPSRAQGSWDNRLDASVKAQVAQWRGDSGPVKADNPLQYLPAAVYAGLGFAGAGDGNIAEYLAAGATAYTVEAVLVNGFKYTACRMRPDGSRANSFPSGHTATAFTGAELVRLEYGPWWGAGAYLVASGVGFLRIYNNRHWFTDVLAGAATGVLSANVAWRLLPLERRWFGIPSGRGGVTLLPSVIPDGPGHAVSFGLSCSLQF